VLAVSRSQLHQRLRTGLKGRGRHLKTDDAQLLEPLRRLVDERPTYGYRRIGAPLNRRTTAGRASAPEPQEDLPLDGAELNAPAALYRSSSRAFGLQLEHNTSHYEYTFAVLILHLTHTVWLAPTASRHRDEYSLNGAAFFPGRKPSLWYTLGRQCSTDTLTTL